MTLCDDLAPALAALQDRHAWRCNPLPDGRRVLIHTGRNRADSEPVTLLAAFFDADTVLISDGGETLNRLGDVGFDRDDPLFEAIWQEALRTYRLSEVDGRVFLQAPLTRAPHAMNRLADALVALDGLRIVTLPQQDKRRTLADQVEDYLYRILPTSAHVTRRPQVKLRSGLVLRPALALDVHNDRAYSFSQVRRLPRHSPSPTHTPRSASSPKATYPRRAASWSLAAHRRHGT